MRRFLFVLTASTALSFTAVGCGRDNPTGPVNAVAPSHPASRSVATGAAHAGNVTPLGRDLPVAAAMSATAEIGPDGGVLSLPATGLTVVVPPGAVNKLTQFTVTALPGSAVAYEFAPAGLRFKVPLVATQSLRGTQAQAAGSDNPLSLFVGYFPDPNDITRVTESLSVTIDGANHSAEFRIWHFSGYIFATGDE
jgi:hypothetical protein